MNPHTTITLDHARVCISHSDGITWVLTTDLGLGDESLAAHLDAAAQVRRHALATLVERLDQVAGLPQGFWFVARGGRRRLLEACGHRRAPYVDAVAAAAGLMMPLVTKTHSGEPFRSARTVFGPLCLALRLSCSLACRCCLAIDYLQSPEGEAARAVPLVMASQVADAVRSGCQGCVGCCLAVARRTAAGVRLR